MKEAHDMPPFLHNLNYIWPFKCSDTISRGLPEHALVCVTVLWSCGPLKGDPMRGRGGLTGLVYISFLSVSPLRAL